MAGVTSFLGKAVNEVIKYNKSMSDSAGATGMGVEELSRFVQTADDFGVSMDSVTRSLELATKNGFAPSIDSIADLADKTNAMSSPTERAAYLAKILGRNWAELDPILRAGGKRVREVAASQADGLVVTDEEIRQTEKLRLRIDSLTDSWTAWRNTVGLKVVTEIDLESRAMLALNEAIKDQEPTLFNAKGSANMYALAWREVINELGRVDAMTAGIGDLGSIKAKFDVHADTSKVAGDLSDVAVKVGSAEYWADLRMQVSARAASAVDESRLAFLEWLRIHPEMQLTITEKVEFASGTGDKSFCFAAGAPVHMATGEDRPIEAVAVGDIVEAYDPELGRRCPAVVESTNRHAADHVNLLEFSNGVVIRATDEHPFLTPTGWAPVSELEPGAAVVASDGRLAVLETRRRQLGTYEVFNLTVVGVHTYVVSGLVVHNKQKAAAGADFIVPPGYPNDSYPMLVQSGERVQVTPPGKTSGANVTINVTSSPLDTQYMTRAIKAAVGM